MVEIPVERLKRQSKLAVHIRYGFPLSLRIRKGSQPPKKYWSKMNRTQDRTKADDQIWSRDVEKSDGARNTASEVESGHKPRICCGCQGDESEEPCQIPNLNKKCENLASTMQLTIAVAARPPGGEGVMTIDSRNQLFQISQETRWPRRTKGK